MVTKANYGLVAIAKAYLLLCHRGGFAEESRSTMLILISFEKTASTQGLLEWNMEVKCFSDSTIARMEQFIGPGFTFGILKFLRDYHNNRTLLSEDTFTETTQTRK